MADALEEANAAASGAKIWKDLFSGAVGGVAQVLIGMVLDMDTGMKEKHELTSILRSTIWYA
jgi:hypothetical protein